MGMSYGHCSKCHRVLEDTNGVCLIGYFLIDGKPVCKECAKKMKGRCPVCGDYKGLCKHKEIK